MRNPACSSETKLKENLGIFSCSEVIVRMLGWFLHFPIAFKVGCSMLSDKGSQPSQFGIFRFFTADEKKLFSFFATFPQSVNKESLSSVKFFLKIELYSIKAV